MKQLKDLPQDVDALFFHKKGVNEKNLQTFLTQLGDLLRDRLTAKPDDGKETIRMSKLGVKDRKLWFEHNVPQERTLEGSKNGLKFIYGDIIEQLILFLAKEAGHTVEDEQHEVELNGVKGHKDGRIDGVTVDVKSASRFGFTKFAKGTLLRGDDPFGYVAQLSAYMHCDGADKGAFIGVNKESGEMCILPVEKMDTIDPVKRIEEVRAIVSSPSPPEKKCYEPVPDGTAGNMVLDTNCGYCIFKQMCWKDANNGLGLRVFDYASGNKYFTTVTNTPRVEEITSKVFGDIDAKNGS